MPKTTTRYLSRTEVAQRIGVLPTTLSRYKLPEPDVIVGTHRGWKPSTIDAWNAARPGSPGSAARKSHDIGRRILQAIDEHDHESTAERIRYARAQRAAG